MKLVYATTDLVGLHPIFGEIISKLDALWLKTVEHELHILHGLDGKHSRFSRHYQGCAIDIRTWVDPTTNVDAKQIAGKKRRELAIAVRKVIGKNFKLLDHGTHFHISFKPEYKAWTKL